MRRSAGSSVHKSPDSAMAAPPATRCGAAWRPEEPRAGRGGAAVRGCRGGLRAGLREELHGGFREGFRAGLREELHGGLSEKLHGGLCAGLREELRAGLHGGLCEELREGLQLSSARLGHPSEGCVGGSMVRIWANVKIIFLQYKLLGPRTITHIKPH